MVIEVREVQFSKALFPIVVTESGMVIDVREMQPKKALIPIFSKDGGNDTKTKFEDSVNNPLIASFPSGIILIFVRDISTETTVLLL